MSVYFDATMPPNNDPSTVATTLGQASLGGTIGVRIIIDDALLTSKHDALRLVRAIKNKLAQETWPLT